MTITLASVGLPTWVAHRTASAEGLGIYERNIVSPHGGTVLTVSASGLNAFAKEFVFWDSHLVTCEFQSNDGKNYTAETYTLDVTDAGYATCGNPGSPCGVGLACEVPAMKMGSVATVSINWNGRKSTALKYEGIPDGNKVYVAEYVSSLTLGTLNGKTIQVVKGAGFGTQLMYWCAYYDTAVSSFKFKLRATFVDSSTLHCDQPLGMSKHEQRFQFDAGHIKKFDVNPSGYQLGLTITVGEKGTQALGTSKPKGFPGAASSVAKPLVFKASASLCTDGVKGDWEIGTDCGKKACARLCKAGVASVAEKLPCDQDADCKAQKCDKGVCLGAMSCTELYRSDPKMKSGVYEIGLDLDTQNLKVRKNGIRFKEYDKQGNFVGAWTLVQTMAATQGFTNFFNRYTHTSDWNIQTAPWDRWKAGDQNFASIVSHAKWNSIFKHSGGSIMTRYANNQNGYQVVDVYGDPWKNKHVLDQTCSHLNDLRMAWARPPLRRMLSHSAVFLAQVPCVVPNS